MRQSVQWGVVALLLSSVVAAGDAADPANVQSSAAPNNPLTAWPIEFLSDTRDRPLFSPHRRPQPPPAPSPVRVVAPPPPVPPPNIVLMAIVTDDGVPQAVVRTPEKAIGAHVGDEIAGWKVTQIEPRRLVLASDYSEVSFDLFGRMSGKSSVVYSPPTAILAAIARRSSASAETWGGPITWGGPMTLPTTDPRSSKRSKMPVPQRK
jgi:general secretion pathway protein N